MAYLKPQSPLKNNDDYIYPLTTADQVIMEDGSRLNDSIISMDKIVNNFTTTEEGFVADARALKTLNDNKLHMELLWENEDPSSEFGEIEFDINGDNCEFVIVVFKLSTTSSNYRTFICERAEQIWCSVAAYNPLVRPVILYRSSIYFGYGRYYAEFGNAKTTQDNTIMIPVRIYGIKGGVS